MPHPLGCLAETGRHGRPWIIAHRGDSFHAPENTIEAAIKGCAAGADAWEFDVQLTADGVPVVLHDETLVRTTDVAERYRSDQRSERGFPVAEFAAEELRTLDAGSWFVAAAGGPRTARAFGSLDALPPSERALYASGRVRIPTLREALERTAELDWIANIELKPVGDRGPRLLDAVLSAIDATGCAGRVWLSSFDHRVIARLARLRPELPSGVLTVNALFSPAIYVRELVNATAYHPWSPALGTVEEQAALRAAGIPTFVFTVNDWHLADTLRSAGVHGIFTDDPAGLAAHWPRSRTS